LGVGQPWQARRLTPEPISLSPGTARLPPSISPQRIDQGTSGGKAENIEVGAFLSQSGQSPEHRELLRLIGTLVKGDHSSAGGTAARIKSHAKSYIVELTDGSKWRIWPGDLATTLGWTPDAEIETLPIEDEFCSHVLVDRSGGPGCVRLRRVAIGPLKNCANS
jgi:hypothetical protein